MALLLILCLAVGLRFYLLDGQSFWNDEGNSARLSERSIALIIAGTASDIHPPLYYLLLHGWRMLLGSSEFGLRAFSAVCGVLLVAVTYALGLVVTDRQRQLASVAALLVAVNPTLVYYSQETRMYMLLPLLATLSTLLLLRWLQQQQAPLVAGGYVLSLAAGLYTHYFFPVVLLLHGLIMASWLGQRLSWLTFTPLRLLAERPLRATVGKWLGLVALALLLYAPWLPIFWRQAGGRPTVRGAPLQFLQESLPWLLFGNTFDNQQIGWTLLAGLLLLAGLFWARRHWTVLLTALLPLLFAYAIGTTQPQFFKFLLLAVPGLALLLAGGLLQLRARRLQALLGLLLLGLLWGNGRSLQNIYFDPSFARADYRSMAQRITDSSSTNAGIILNAPNQWEVFTYYYDGAAPVYPLPPGNRQPTAAEIDATLSEIAANHERLYAIFWGEAQRDPERLVERWLDAHAFKAADEWVQDVRFVTYAVPQAATAKIETAVAARFGNNIELIGYTLHADSLTPGEIVQITLFWKTAVPLTQRYKIFLHLLDEEGQLVAQRDSEPGGGHTLTTVWEPNRQIIDNHGILVPPTAPSGSYRLLLGLYELGNPAARLPVTVDGSSSDILLLRDLTITN